MVIERRAWLGVLVGVLLGCAEDPPSPSPVIAALVPAAVEVDPDLSDAACERCHVADARSHAASAHASAFSDEVFQAEWAAHTQPECVRCHAPLADPEHPEGEAAARGISCTVCHLREGSVLSVHAAPDAPHPITVDGSLGTSEACASCHEFTFASVAPTPYDEAGMLQGTLSEWHEVEERGTCQSCHLRDELDRVTHAMPGAREPALLTRALSVEASARVVGEHLEVTLILRSEAGHAVPTGDMYRRLEVRAWVAGHERATASRVLMRRFSRVDGVLRQVEDDRVPPLGERRVVLELPQGRAARVHWQITWQALDPALAEARWLPEDVVERVMIEGEVEVEAVGTSH